MKRVFIVYHIIPHYRIPIFNLLSKDEDVHYTIISGSKANINVKKASSNLSEKKIEDGGIRWLILKNFWLLNRLLFQKGLLKILRTSDYDTVIFLGNMYYISTWAGAVVSKIRKKKVVFWTHGYTRKEKNLIGYIRLLFYSLADDLLVYGGRAKEILKEKGYPEQHVHLIYNSLDYELQCHIRNSYEAQHNKKSQTPTFGFIGRLTPQKKLHVLVQVLRELISKGKNAHLLLIGDGTEKDKLVELANSYKLMNYITFYGACYDEVEIFKLLSKMNVVVSPGEVGLTAIHALTYGVPVITHNNFSKQMPEYEAIIPGDTGDFFDYDNQVESLVHLIDKWLFRENHKEVSHKCYQIIEQKYNPQNQLKILNKLV